MVLLLAGLLSQAAAFAQQNSNSIDATMRGSGKIYVVVASCVLILLGLFFYVFTIDRKISKLEK